MLDNILSDTDFKQLTVLFFIKAAFNFCLFIIILAWSGDLLPYMVICIIMIVSDSAFSGYSIYVELDKTVDAESRREKLCNSLSSITQAYQIIPYFVLILVLWTHFVALKNVGKTPKSKGVNNSARKFQRSKIRPHDSDIDSTSGKSDHDRNHDISARRNIGFNQDAYDTNSAISYFRENVTNNQYNSHRAQPFNIKAQRAGGRRSIANRTTNDSQIALAIHEQQTPSIKETALTLHDDYDEEDQTNGNITSVIKDSINSLGWGAIALEKSQNPKVMLLPALLIWFSCFLYSFYNLFKKKAYYDYITETCVFIILSRGVTMISLSVILSIILIPIIYILRSFLEWWLDLGNWDRKERELHGKQGHGNSLSKKLRAKDKEMSIHRQGRGSKSMETAIKITDMLTEPVDILIEILSTYRNFFRLWIWYILYGLVMFFDRLKIENIPVLEFNALWVAYIDSYAAYFVISIYPKLFKHNRGKDSGHKLLITKMSEYSMWTSLFEILHDKTPSLDRKFMIFICHLLQFMFCGLRVWHHAVTTEPKIKKLIFFSKSTPISMVTWIIGFLIVETYLVK